ncbi:MAG: diguanylate phosphodiesterase [Herbinix sp.]|jgi:EAL and modified HD-GYP domain-containing signal transduction protein|nr:diguanylate phosphodiesterase [Herbinix sp.]
MYIARQPIFDKVLKVYGYELLFRSDSQSTIFDGNSSMQATASVVGGLYEAQIEIIADNKRVFINFDEQFLQYDFLELLDTDKLVIEVLETVTISETLINRLEELKTKGYKIALDDFAESYAEYPLTRLADIIKYDLRETPLETITEDMKRALRQNKVLLAEKVETFEEFRKAKEMGFHLFQGFFFSRPSIVSKSREHTTTKAQYTRLLQELKSEEPSFQKLAEIIEQDPNLAYRLLHVVSNKAKDDLVYSIKRALSYMGLNELERWINILMLRELGDEKPDELLMLSLIRAKFAEYIARNSNKKYQKFEASIMGLFSVMDALLDEPMDQAIKDISISVSVKEALMERSGDLAQIYDLILAYEGGDWDKVECLCGNLKVKVSLLQEGYINAVRWAGEIMALF